MTAFGYCIHCKCIIDPVYTTVHRCYGTGGKMDVTKRKWNHQLRCWVLADDWKDERQKTIVQQVLEAKRKDDVRTIGRYYDNKLNAWVDVETGKTESGPKLESCAIDLRKGTDTTTPHDAMCICDACKPFEIRIHADTCPCTKCYEWWKSKGKTDYRSNYSHGSGYKPYVSVKPWEGIDREKWPSTYMFCVSLYYINNIWYHGKTIPDADYKDRIINKVYKPEPKYGRYWKDDDDNWGPYGGV